MQQFIQRCQNPEESKGTSLHTMGLIHDYNYSVYASCENSQTIDKIQGARREALRQLMPGPEDYKLTKTENGSLGLPTAVSNFILDYTETTYRSALKSLYIDEKSNKTVHVQPRNTKLFFKRRIPKNKKLFLYQIGIMKVCVEVVPCHISTTCMCEVGNSSRLTLPFKVLLTQLKIFMEESYKEGVNVTSQPNSNHACCMKYEVTACQIQHIHSLLQHTSKMSQTRRNQHIRDNLNMISI